MSKGTLYFVIALLLVSNLIGVYNRDQKDIEIERLKATCGEQTK